jgi:ribA/ribD-fused uncharacterized protein
MSNYKNTHLFFYGKSKEFGEFSNFYPCTFSDGNDVRFNCSEQYMMHGKAVLFDPDNKIVDSILAENLPTKIKRLGRRVKNFVDTIWDDHKFEIVYQGNLLKFSQNEELKQVLLGTGNKIIVEASPRDKIWGIGLSREAAQKIDPSEWPGQNLLGQVLMRCRKELRK